MTAYAAFLRGVNLGPSNKVAMPRLRELAEQIGWQDVRTYINSGNVVFTAAGKPATLVRELERALEDEFGRRIDVAVRSRAALAETLRHNPFPDRDGRYVTVSFLMRAVPAGVEGRLAEWATDREPFAVRGSEIWVHYGDGQARSRLAARFADVVGASATTRTVNTVTKVLALLG